MPTDQPPLPDANGASLLDLDAACRVVEREANSARGRPPQRRLRVLRDAIVARAWGWVIYYGDGYADIDLDGERPTFPPYLVNCRSGEILGTGSAWPVRKYVEDYETRLLGEARTS
jgi:hypothetical protein